MNIQNPNILKETARGIQPISLEDELFNNRKIYLIGEVNTNSMTSLLMQLECLENSGENEEITIYINSPGGDVRSGLAVYDYIMQMKSPVKTVCIGVAASMGAILFLAGEKREMYKHSEVMIHDPSMLGGNYEKPLELQTRLESLMEMRETLAKIISSRTDLDIKAVYKATKTDTYYNAEKALKYGLATKIISNKEDTVNE